jgi:hypothetical protein
MLAKAGAEWIDTKHCSKADLLCQPTGVVLESSGEGAWLGFGLPFNLVMGRLLSLVFRITIYGWLFIIDASWSTIGAVGDWTTRSTLACLQSVLFFIPRNFKASSAAFAT